MALSLINAGALSPWRVRAYFAGGDPTGEPAGNFSIARQDSGPGAPAVAAVIPVDTAGVVDLALAEPLLPNVVHVLTWSAQTAIFTYSENPDGPQLTAPTDDPEAELLGVDVCWLYASPDASGDAPQRRGQECLVNDLAARGELSKGELVHLPNAGASLPASVNGPASDDELATAAGALDADFRSDPRVQDVSVTSVETTDEGAWNFQARVTPRALGVPLKVSNT